MAQYIEDSPGLGLFVRQFGLKTKKAVDFSLASSVALPAGVTAGAQIISSNSANAFTVGLNGTTNPAFNVDSSTPSQAAGLNIIGAATGGTVALAAIDSGSNTNLSINGKGSGSITLGNVSTGGINLADPTTVTSNSANALAVGQNGTTTPALNIDASTASSITGLNIKSAATGNGIALSALGGTNEDFIVLSKGTGKFRFSPGSDSTNIFQLTKADGTTNAFQVDTTNSRIKLASPTQFIPNADAVNAYQFCDTTNSGVIAVDTTNKRVALGNISTNPAFAVDIFGVSNFRGNLTITANNIVTDTTTGMQIATGATQKLGFFGATPVVQVTDGAALTNSVTSGGTTNTIANYTDLTVYANDSAAIRNDIYQLSRKLKIVDDALRLYGLLS